jgi:hypothetical protein
MKLPKSEYVVSLEKKLENLKNMLEGTCGFDIRNFRNFSFERELSEDSISYRDACPQKVKKSLVAGVTGIEILTCKKAGIQHWKLTKEIKWVQKSQMSGQFWNESVVPPTKIELRNSLLIDSELRIYLIKEGWL